MFIFILVFADINQNNRIFIFAFFGKFEYNHIHICPKKLSRIYSYLYFPKNVNPNIFVFVFAKKYRPEYICNCIQVWELYLSHTGSLERVIVEQKMIFNKLKFFWMDFYLEKFSLNKYFHTIIVYNGICKL